MGAGGLAAQRLGILAPLPAGRAVGDEDQVELAPFGRLRQFAIMIDIVAGIGLGIAGAARRRRDGRWP